MKPRVSPHFFLPGALAVMWLLSGAGLCQEVTLERLVERAQAAVEVQNWEQALALNTQVVTLYGGEREKYGAQFGAVHFRKGLCEMKLKRWQDALRSFETCYQDFPNRNADRGNLFHTMALLKWGEAAMGAERWELALSRFAKFREERDPARDAFPQGAYYINLAVCHYKLGRIPQGNENLEIAIRNKADFPTPDAGMIAGFQALVEVAIAKKDEQALLDFIGKNRGELVIRPAEMRGYAGVFLKLAGDALAAGMTRAALAVYQFVPASEADPQRAVMLAALALIHEKAGNVRGALAAYMQIERCHATAAGREDYLYHLVRCASRVGEEEMTRRYASRFLKDFPDSARAGEVRGTGIEVMDDCAAPSLEALPVTDVEFPETREFAVALDLYQGRKYREARAAFALLGTAHPLAAFYQMECFRKLGDLDGMAAAVVVKDPALGADRLRQLELAALWEAVRTRNWPQVGELAQARAQQVLPGDQRAQIEYCHGLACENLARPDAALLAYNTALTADAGASEEIARAAALGVLRIHLADPEVQAALADPVPNDDPGHFRLREAAAVAGLFELSLGAGTPLPAAFKELLKYQGKP